MEALIVTGASRGLGAALMVAGRERFTMRIGLARSGNYAGEAEAAALAKIRVDLGNPDELKAASGSLILGLRGMPGLKSLTVVHNAATLVPTARVTSLKAGELAHGLQLNLLAPMILTTDIVNFAREQRLALNMVFISSSVATKPKAGWAAYCAAKSGLELFARTLAVEEPDVRVLIVDPGIMNTEMQFFIRHQTPQNFPEVDRFREFMEKGLLAEPAVVAERILAAVADAGISSGSLVKAGGN